MVIKSVTFFGGADSKPKSRNFEGARETAKLISQTGRTIINGGGPGVMLAATTGAKEANGKTTVVYYRPELATDFEGPASFNMADTHFVEENYILRTKKLLELGDAYVIFNGGTGTISEFGMAWGVAKLYFGHNKPIILYGNFWHHLINDFREHMMVRKQALEVFTIVNTPEEALAALEKYEKIVDKNRRLKGKINHEESDLIL